MDKLTEICILIGLVISLSLNVFSIVSISNINPEQIIIDNSEMIEKIIDNTITIEGERGLRGREGDDGDDGINGHQGENGLIGLQGLQGEQGVPGIPGDSLTDKQEIVIWCSEIYILNLNDTLARIDYPFNQPTFDYGSITECIQHQEN